jgi:hypothetical protein
MKEAQNKELRSKELPKASIFVYSMLLNPSIQISIENQLSGSLQPQLPIRDLLVLPIRLP